jgi:2-haloacid dehalogenase
MPLTVDLLAVRRAVVFDAYGTLFDVHAAVARHAAAVGPDAARLSEIWRAKQLEYSWVLSLAGRYEPFWTLTERALDHAFARCPAVDRALREPLLDAYRTLDAFPDADLTGVVREVQGGAAGEFSPFPRSNTAGNYQKVTQVIPVKIAVDDTQGLGLVPGMNVTVKIHKGN